MFGSMSARLALAAAMFASVAGVVPAAAAVDQSCATTGPTITADAVGRVYSGSSTPIDATVYACVYGHAPVVIADSDLGSNPHFDVELSGRYVAVATDLFQPFFAEASLRVFDLSTGRVIGRPRPATKGQLITITALVSRGRAVAWIASRKNLIRHGTDETAPIYEVHRADAHGASLLDSGRTIAPESLALSSAGSRIYWLHGNSLHTARL